MHNINPINYQNIYRQPQFSSFSPQVRNITPQQRRFSPALRKIMTPQQIIRISPPRIKHVYENRSPSPQSNQQNIINPQHRRNIIQVVQKDNSGQKLTQSLPSLQIQTQLQQIQQQGQIGTFIPQNNNRISIGRDEYQNNQILIEENKLKDNNLIPTPTNNQIKGQTITISPPKKIIVQYDSPIRRQIANGSNTRNDVVINQIQTSPYRKKVLSVPTNLQPTQLQTIMKPLGPSTQVLVNNQVQTEQKTLDQQGMQQVQQIFDEDTKKVQDLEKKITHLLDEIEMLHNLVTNKMVEADKWRTKYENTMKSLNQNISDLNENNVQDFTENLQSIQHNESSDSEKLIQILKSKNSEIESLKQLIFAKDQIIDSQRKDLDYINQNQEKKEVSGDSQDQQQQFQIQMDQIVSLQEQLNSMKQQHQQELNQLKIDFEQQKEQAVLQIRKNLVLDFDKQKQKQLKESKKTINELEQEKEKLSLQANKLISEINRLQKIIIEKDNDLGIWKKRYEQFKIDKDQEIYALNQKLQESERQRSKDKIFDTQIKEMEKLIIELQNQNKNLKEQLSNQSNQDIDQNKKLDNENKRLIELLNQHVSQIVDWKVRYAALEKQQKQFAAEVSPQKQQENQLLQGENQKLNIQIIQLQKELQTLKEQSMNENNESYKEELQHVYFALDQKNNELSTLQKKYNILDELVKKYRIFQQTISKYDLDQK